MSYLGNSRTSEFGSISAVTACSHSLGLYLVVLLSKAVQCCLHISAGKLVGSSSNPLVLRGSFVSLTWFVLGGSFTSLLSELYSNESNSLSPTAMACCECLFMEEERDIFDTSSLLVMGGEEQDSYDKPDITSCSCKSITD